VFIAKLREALKDVAPTMCTDCQRRAVTNPLRVLDCKVPADQPVIDALPSILDNLDEGCQKHLAAVKTYLEDRGIAYTMKPRLVRGLDYYTRTTFEITHGSLGAQNSVLGGGRYNGLAELLGSKVRAPGIGFSIGEDRLVMSVEEKLPQADAVDLFMAPMDEESFRHCALLAHEVRQSGSVVEVAAEGKLKRLLELANKLSAKYALIVGETERTAELYTLKNMATGEQEKLSRRELIEKFHA
jgi:histidyl-tRNA synthetase